MNNILLVEPDYRSKFPPLGLLRLSTYHKELGDAVTFVRGRCDSMRSAEWHRVYVASLFTWELPRTIRTIKYYRSSVCNANDIIVGGIGATLMPDYIRQRVDCKVVVGPLDRRGVLGVGEPAISRVVPDYGIVASVEKHYEPDDAYFCRATVGCVRKCKFCSVPKLERRFGAIRRWREQMCEARDRFGERQHLVMLDNNVLADPNFERIVRDIRREGFEAGARLNGRKRTIDFNQGIDARLVTKRSAIALSTIALAPVRLAFDQDGVEPGYRRAVQRLAERGFAKFTTYMMFNWKDRPESLYRRMRVNLELAATLKVGISAFPMRFVPIDDVQRQYVGSHWHWRYLRGIQCVLLATHGVVSPNPEFFDAAFGRDLREFFEILCMPDRYIIHRERHRNNGASDWRRRFRRLTPAGRREFLDLLERLNPSRNKERDISRQRRYRALLDHYYPGGRVIRG